MPKRTEQVDREDGSRNEPNEKENTQEVAKSELLKIEGINHSDQADGSKGGYYTCCAFLCETEGSGCCEVMLSEEAWADIEFEVALDSGAVDHFCDDDDAPGYQ